ncbi:MAG: glycine cleavage system aminomethyltransferase GcvT [Myxococcota bacterium]
MTDDVKSVPLESRHEKLGGRMVEFAGYRMPVQYDGIKDEHHAVRHNVGLFDVSHMGEVEVRGPDAVTTVDSLVTNDASALVDGQAMYTVMCKPDGGIVDDMVVYRLADNHFMICVNAANREKDFAFMQEHVRGEAELVDRSDEYVQLAVQGPNAESLLQEISEIDLSTIAFFRSRFGEVGGTRSLVARTGYTGEDGFELYIPAAEGEMVFDALLDTGSRYDLQMCGLGARDTLRLEAKLHLYGQDIDETTHPYEAGLGWVVKPDKDADFVGKEALADIKEQGVSRRLRGLVLQGRGVIRPGYEIYAGDDLVGEVTSGTYSPTLEESIGLGYIAVDHANDEIVDVDIRGRRVAAKTTRKPFYSRD